MIIPSEMQSDSLSNNSDPIIEGLISITSTSSSSSSSSGESFDVLLELNDTKSDDKKVTTPKLEEEIPSSPKHVLEDTIKWAPPVQTMGRPNNIPGYDPNRIPSTIFSSKPSSAMDWSVTSNESLFSIHMGNNSFSGDHAILMGKSGEFYNFDDLISVAPSQQQPTKPIEVNNSPYNLPTVVETATDNEKREDIAKNPSVKVNNSPYNLPTVVETTTDSQKRWDIGKKPSVKVILEDNNKETSLSKISSNISDCRETPARDSTRTSASTTPRLSDVSGTNSSNSFAFPVLTGEVGNHHAPIKLTHENVHPRHVDKPKRQPQPETEPPHKINHRAFSTRWFSWFRVRTCTFSLPRCSFCC